MGLLRFQIRRLLRDASSAIVKTPYQPFLDVGGVMGAEAIRQL